MRYDEDRNILIAALEKIEADYAMREYDPDYPPRAIARAALARVKENNAGLEIAILEEQAKSHMLDAAGWEESCYGARGERDIALAWIERMQKAIVEMERHVTRNETHFHVPREQYLNVVEESYS